MRRHGFLFAVMVTLTAEAVGAVTLQPHLGVYDLSLTSARSDGGVREVQGRLAIEIVDSCDGFAQTQRMLLKMVSSDGREVLSDSNHITWESRDGRAIRFDMKNTIDGKVDEEFVGHGEMKGSGGGRVSFSKPVLADLELAPGTVFPTQHFIDLITAGLAGKGTLNRRVYDGSGPKGVYDTVALLAPATGPSRDAAPAEKLAGEKSWRARIAYFAVGGTRSNDKLDPGGLPEYEVGFRLHENGVATDIVLDYGNFVLRGTLRRLDYLPKNC
jgi:hypothetical protein